ncbi:MAG: GyrI-like domain-containing protein [bacterium]|nr:GyrI-like domain-containing protein [bacterium]
MALGAKKFFTLFSVFLIPSVLLAGWIGYYLGVFSPVELNIQARGPYLMVFMMHRGAYHQILEKIERVGKLLDERKIPKTVACAIFYDDPRDVPLESLRSEGGYLVDRQLSLEHPFGQQKIPRRTVIVARVKAHPLIAPFKTYGRIVDFMKMHNLKHSGPAMERYLADGVVEVEIPFEAPDLEMLRRTARSLRQ